MSKGGTVLSDLLPVPFQLSGLGVERNDGIGVEVVLWNFYTGFGMRGGIVSYAVDGEQYILVPSGWGSYAALLMPALLPQLEKVPGASTLIAFKVSK